ncbi:MAG: glycerophosphodiester phosphodiesterase [Alphaproteobacteria bacterium]|nr:MAG: glycerophosphodiester phosphodiesterase [Alphaproteobacteria bacterium]
MNKIWLTGFPFAHRGLHGSPLGVVENSLSAFHAANDRGHGFELDILLSKDDKAMVFHDVSLERLTGTSGNIQDFTALALAEIKLGNTSDSIPTLSKILSEIDQNYPILIEIKGDQGHPVKIAKAVFSDIKGYNGPIAIMSFYPKIIEWFKANAPHVLRGLVATSINDGEMPNDFFSIETQKEYVEGLEVDFIAYDIKALPNDLSEYCRKKNIPVLTWTVRSEPLQKKAAQYSDNIIYENLKLSQL